VAVGRDGTVRVYYLVASDDRLTTVITGNPKPVVSLRTDDIAVRLPCRGRATGAGRSPYGLLFGEHGGTAYCAELAGCLASAPPPPARYAPAVVDDCLSRAAW